MPVEIIHVNDNNSAAQYNTNLTKKPVVIVLYYMDGCGHCDEMKPEWKKFEKYAKNSNKFDGMVAKINARHLNDIEGDKDVMGYPTIFRLLNKKKHEEYEGERTLNGFKQFLLDSININKHMIGGGRKKRRTRKRKQPRKVKKYRKSTRKRRVKKRKQTKRRRRR